MQSNSATLRITFILIDFCWVAYFYEKPLFVILLENKVKKDQKLKIDTCTLPQKRNPKSVNNSSFSLKNLSKRMHSQHGEYRQNLLSFPVFTTGMGKEHP